MDHIIYIPTYMQTAPMYKVHTYAEQEFEKYVQNL